MLQFKDSKLTAEWHDAKLRPELRVIVLAANGYAELRYERSLVVSSIYRTPEDNAALHSKSFTHPEWRAVDCSAHGFERVKPALVDWTQEEFDDIGSFVNNLLDTGFGSIMPVCYSEKHGTGKHLHFQVAKGNPPKFRS